jgi:hypothetical protein
MKLLIDADYLVYNSGFAGEHRRYLAYVDDLEGEFGIYGPYPDKTSATSKHPNADLYERLSLEPIENVLHSCKRQIEAIIRKTAKRTKTKEDALDVQLYLTGSGNFRERVATITPYKGNRDPRHKPAYMRQIREYLCNVWNAEVIYGIEADDEVSIIQSANPDDVCVAGIDKDLLQVPGLHYIPKKGFKNISERSGLLRLYWQILCGDATDNIKGCYKLGAKGALKLVKSTAAEADPDVDSFDVLLWLEVLKQYKQSIEKYGDEIYGGLSAYKAAIENARLVYMLREKPADYFNPPLWEPPI